MERCTTAFRCTSTSEETARGEGATVRITLDGGDILVDWRDDGVWMTGPTSHVFDGVFTTGFLAGS